MLLAFGLLDVSVGLGLKSTLPDLPWLGTVPSAVSSVPTLAGFWLEGWREESRLGIGTHRQKPLAPGFTLSDPWSQPLL